MHSSDICQRHLMDRTTSNELSSHSSMFLTTAKYIRLAEGRSLLHLAKYALHWPQLLVHPSNKEFSGKQLRFLSALLYFPALSPQNSGRPHMQWPWHSSSLTRSRVLFSCQLVLLRSRSFHWLIGQLGNCWLCSPWGNIRRPGKCT